MACLIVPAVEAIVVTVIEKALAQQEASKISAKADVEACAHGTSTQAEGFSLRKKLGHLRLLLWGGAALLALEHIGHGEIVFYPPFLSGLANPADTATMLREMATVGVAMAATVTLLWMAGEYILYRRSVGARRHRTDEGRS